MSKIEMKVLIAGASGLIGKYLIAHFTNLGYTIVGLSRSASPQHETSPNIKWKLWKENDASDWQDELENCDVVINLIGESITGKKWTKERKEELLSSRVNACNLFVKAIANAKRKPKTFFQASAIGIYSAGQDSISEDNGEKGGNFLADLTIEWEKASEKIEQYGVKRILLRIGLVLAPDSLIITKFKLAFMFFAGGHLGSGKQIMSWIHMDDLITAISFIISNSKDSHIYNLTAPHPVTMRKFCNILGKSMYRPSWLHVPGYVLKLLFGKEMAEQTMLSGETVLPANLLKLEFAFKYPAVYSALISIV